MNAFTREQMEALRALGDLWRHTRLSLVGAAGLASQMPGFHRQTNDLDVTVAVSLNDLASDIEKLSGWQRHPRLEHQWQSPAGVKVDLIPAGAELLSAGQITWPSGHAMSLLGFRHAFSHVRSLALADDLSIDVATVAVIALLKAIAYQERPHDRTRDLGDLAFILEHYVPEDDARRFSDGVLDAGISYEEVSAYLLGCDLAAMINEGERHALESFMARAEGEEDGGVTRALILQQGPADWREHPANLSAVTRGLRRGLAAVQSDC